MLCVDFPILKDFQYRHIPEFDCQVYPKHAIYAMLPFVTITEDILHLQNVRFQYRMAPFLRTGAHCFYKKMERSFLEIVVSYDTGIIFVSKILHDITIKKLQYTFVSFGSSISFLLKTISFIEQRITINDTTF